MNDLNEQALEEAITELTKLQRDAKGKLYIKPTRLFLRIDLINELSQQYGVSVVAMLAIIRRLVRDATDA